MLAAAARAGEQRGQGSNPNLDEEEDPVAAYSDLLRQAVSSARKVYRTLLRALLRTHGSVGEAGMSLWQGLCQTLIRRVIGAYADAEMALSEQYQQRVVLTGSEEELKALFSEHCEGPEAFLRLHKEFYRT